MANWHEAPALVAWWQACFGPLLGWLAPRRRRLILAAAGIVVLFRHPLAELQEGTARAGLAWAPAAVLLLPLLLLAFVYLVYLAARRFALWPVWAKRHPQICLHALFWAGTVGFWFWRPTSPLLVTLFLGWIMVMPFLLWRLGYMLASAQRGKIALTTFSDHFFYLFPVWGGSDTPYGKGWDYLSANEARDTAGLARAQLAGIKLFGLAGLWWLVSRLMKSVVFGEPGPFQPLLPFSLDLPRLGEMFDGGYSRGVCWVALYAELVWTVLILAMKGHIIIGWLRLAGFQVFRNTYRPLLAQTVIEFWNRYYYYFKELLVNFFFFPTYTRHFKTSPRVRICAAVFMAAFVGNTYYHWLALDAALATANFAAMWATLQSRMFYCLLLAAGICVSMLREQARGRATPSPTLFRKARAIFGVWTFFSIIHIWSEKDPARFLDRLHFFVGLIGLS